MKRFHLTIFPGQNSMKVQITGTVGFSRNHNKLSYAYLLTPSGIEAKAKLTRAFLARKLHEYDRLRTEIEDLQAEVGDAR